MDTLEKRLNAPFADTIALMEQNDKSYFSNVKDFGKKAVSTGLMLTMLYAGTANLSASTDMSYESSPSVVEKEDANPSAGKKKKRSPLAVILGVGAGLVVGAALLLKGKGGEEAKQKYTAHLSGRNVENIDEVVGGDISFKLGNGTVVSGSNSSSLVLEGSNRIVDASVSGQGDYFPGYLVFTDESGAVLGYKDANGMKSFTVNDNQKVFIKYIKNAGFDIKLWGQCLNKNTVKGYDKDIPVGIMNDGSEPLASDYTNMNNVIAEFNKYSKKVKMVNVGKVTALVPDGITVRIGNYTPGHWEKYSGNNITNSEAFLRAGIGIGAYIEEQIQAALGGGDGPNPNWPGRDITNLNDFGKRAISLNYSGLPFGFVISGDSIPASIVSPMSVQSIQPGSFQGSPAFSPGSRSGSHYNSPGNKAGPVSRPKANDYRARKDFERER